MDKIKQRGQFFTTKEKVLNVLVSLISNKGDILEPSAGSGHIINFIENKLDRKVFGCELDSNRVENKICNSDIEIINFFEFIKKNNSYSSVVGNPPFVKLKNVELDTISILPEKISGNGNLYYYFIKYSIELLDDNGELIFITPKEWLYNTSSQFLRDYLKSKGNFTHFIDCGEEKLFDDADVPSLCIFRFQKNYFGQTQYYNTLDDFYNKEYEVKYCVFGKTTIFNYEITNHNKISDFFDVKVGLVTGLESFFKLNDVYDFEEECVIKMMTTSKEMKPYLFLENFKSINDIPIKTRYYLLENKEILINRKMKNFTENNWWKYGAIRNLNIMSSDKPRIYGLLKTRDKNPFWIGSPKTFFSGGVFALFPKETMRYNLENVVDFLNSNEFKGTMKDSNMLSNNKITITPSPFSSLTFNFI